MCRQSKIRSKFIFEPVWSRKYDKGLLDSNIDYRVIGLERLFGIIKDRLEDYKLRHLKLGKVKFIGKPFYKGSFTVEGISNDVAWQTDQYLAVLIRDYLRFHIKNSPAIGNCVLRDNPEGLAYEDFILNRADSSIDYGRRWSDLVNKTADEFDEISLLLKSEPSELKDYKYYEAELKKKVDAAFKDLAYIYCDLNW